MQGFTVCCLVMAWEEPRWPPRGCSVTLHSVSSGKGSYLVNAGGPVLCLLGLCFISVLFSCSVLHSHTALANLPNEPQELHNNNNNNSYYTSTANRKHIGDEHTHTHTQTSPPVVSSWQLWSDTSRPQGGRNNGQRHKVSQIIWWSMSRVKWKREKYVQVRKCPWKQEQCHITLLSTTSQKWT